MENRRSARQVNMICSPFSHVDAHVSTDLSSAAVACPACSELIIYFFFLRSITPSQLALP